MHALLWLVITLLDIIVLLIFVMVIMSWLISFKVFNLNNRFVYMLWDTVNKLTAPLLAPIRRFMPDLGGLDVSPVVLLITVYFLRNLVQYDIAPRLLM